MNASSNRPQMNADECESMNELIKIVIGAIYEVANATELKIALLVNFQNPKVEWKRVVRNF